MIWELLTYQGGAQAKKGDFGNHSTWSNLGQTAPD